MKSINHKPAMGVSNNPAVVKSMLVDGLTLIQWIEKETAQRTAKLWGDSVEFSPVVCDEVIGDGQQLVYLGTVGQRPYYWLIRIDSKTDIESDDFNFEDILEPIERCFGIQEDYMSEKEFQQKKAGGDEEYNIYETYGEWIESNYEYPRIGWDGGHWGLVVNMVTGDVG
jgi:hypothetical protein